MLPGEQNEGLNQERARRGIQEVARSQAEESAESELCTRPGGSRQGREGAGPIGVCLLCGRLTAGPLKDLQEHLEKQNVQYIEI